MIIDFHCHAGRGDLLTDPWNTDAPLDAYFRRARAAGIDRTVVFPPFHSDYAAANEETARVVARHPRRLIGFAFVHPVRDRGNVFDMVRRAVVRWGFRGVKVHGHDGMINREVCEAVRAFRIPLLIDVVGQAAAIDMFAPQYRDVDFVIPHLGSFRDDWRAQQLVVDQLQRHPNVYTDTSGVRRFDYIVQAVRRAGPEKVLFGSDGPWLHPGLELHKIKLLNLTPSAERLILGENALRLLRKIRRRVSHANRASLQKHRSEPVAANAPASGTRLTSDESEFEL